MRAIWWITPLIGLEYFNKVYILINTEDNYVTSRWRCCGTIFKLCSQRQCWGREQFSSHQWTNTKEAEQTTSWMKLNEQSANKVKGDLKCWIPRWWRHVSFSWEHYLISGYSQRIPWWKPQCWKERWDDLMDINSFPWLVLIIQALSDELGIRRAKLMI